MKLYELTEQFLALQELVYDPEVDDQTLQDTMDGLWGEIEEKADGYYRHESRYRGAESRRKSSGCQKKGFGEPPAGIKEQSGGQYA